MWVYVHMSAGVCGILTRSLHFVEPVLQAVVNCLTWMLGIELRSGRIVPALNGANALRNTYILPMP